jgi:hypothetical protein
LEHKKIELENGSVLKLDMTAGNTLKSLDDYGAENNRTDERKGSWMQTYSGRMFWPIDPRADEVHIADIAMALSNQCRYNGHCLRFYSVAEHSVLVSKLVEQKGADLNFVRWALLHDASEAYVCDVPRPLKPFMANYGELEGNVMKAIAEHFELEGSMPQIVKWFDTMILKAEMEQIMSAPPADWCLPEDPAPIVNIVGMDPLQARGFFMERYVELFS